METISLRDVLKLYWGAEVDDLPDIASLMNGFKKREEIAYRFLPEKLIRRLDAGFARSNTVHPDSALALYAICRAMKPTCVFETGTYWGYSTAYLAAAIRDNGRGMIQTFDIYPHAGKHLPKSLLPFVRFHRGKASTLSMPDVLQTDVPDLFFQDSLHDYDGVAGELGIVAPHLKPGAVVLFHDFVVPAVREAAQDVLRGYRFFVLEGGDAQQMGFAISEGKLRDV